MTWFDEAVALLNDDSVHECEAGHPRHERMVVGVTMPVDVDKIICFDGFHYSDTPGYCPGDDDVSRTLSLYGRWEAEESVAFSRVLARSHGTAVIDFGSHVGWYTVLALVSGFDVLAIEGIREHEELTLANARTIGMDHHLHQAHHWVGPGTPYLPAENAPLIACVKIDLEGNEEDAVRSLFELLLAGRIDNILLEVSPIFNDSYPALLRRLMDHHGFSAATVSPWRPFDVLDIEVVVAEQPQIDVILSRNPWWM